MQKSDDSLNLEESGSRDTTQVNFVCQRCFQPLKLDPSLFSMSQDTEHELTAGLSSTIESRFSLHSHCSHLPCDAPDATTTGKSTTSTCDSQVVTKIILPAKTELKGSGFTLIEDASSGSGAHNAKYRADVSAKLFDIMSGNADIDHPLCEECTDVLLNQLDDQLNITEKELGNYKELFNKLESQRVLDDTELDEELRQLQLEEKQLVDELAQVEAEYEEMMAEREEMKATSALIDSEEEVYWREYCDHQKLLLEFEEQQASTHNYLNYAQTQLDKLRKTNVFNSTFHIWHKGHFGTINNFRLGRLPSVPVEWTEINAAWGQTVLLLHSLAKKIGLVFRRYRLVPYGNHSYIDCLDEKNKELPLYGSGGFRFFWDTKFDHAMVAFLDCLQQFKQEVEKGDSKFHLPYRMERGKIYDSSGSGAYSVKIQFNSEEHWTKALKFMLTNLKWGLAWVSSQFADKNS